MIYGPGIIGIDPSPYESDTSLTIDKGKVIIYGDLEVIGNTTTINTSVIEVNDNILRINTAAGSGGLETVSYTHLTLPTTVIV